MIDPNMIRKLQSDLHKNVEGVNTELEAIECEGSAGGGVVKVVATGKRVLKSVSIGAEAIDPDDPEMLQDLILAAVNQAMEKAQEVHEEKMSGVTGGLKLPGIL